MSLTARPCEGCGVTIPRTRKTGPIRTHCETCRPPRWATCRTCGKRTNRTKYCPGACQPRCAVEGCDRPRRKRDWCANHYANWRAKGDPQAAVKYRWAAEHRCLVCGKTPGDGSWESPHRRWCSGPCQRLWYKHKGQVPTGYRCENCEQWVDLVRPGQKRRRSDSRLCGECAKVTVYSMTAWEIAARDGTTCRLCGEEVDLSLRFPHWFSASADHIIPRSNGGSHEPDNLQLAHWICNVRRKDRAM